MNRRVMIKALLIVCAIIIIVVAGYIVGRNLETGSVEEQRGTMSADFGTAKRVEYNGRTYVRKSDITSLLAIGYDRLEDKEPNGFRDGGQSDFLMLIVFDHENKQIRQLQIDRDTITDVTVLSVLGRPSGTRQTQICLSHGFGGTEEERCGYTQTAVENLLLGEKIDLYFSVGLDAIYALNDALGGVTVTLKDDFSAHDPEMTLGKTMTLHGKQAEIFVRSRYDIADGSAAERMKRQKIYFEAATDQILHSMKNDTDYIANLFEAMEEIMSTNILRGRFVNEMNRAYRYEVMPVEFISGEHEIGYDGFMEFHADEASITEWILNVFYK